MRAILPAPYCFENGIDVSRNVLTEEMVDAAFNLHGSQCDEVLIFGGEPLLPITKNIIEYILQKSKEANMIVTIITNGYYLMDFYELLDAYDILMITVTLDGDESLHDRQRPLKNGKGTYATIMKNIDHYIKNNKKIRIRMNVDNNNLVNCLNLRYDLLKKYDDYNKNLSFEISPLFQHSLNDASIFGKFFSHLDEGFDEQERIRRNVYYIQSYTGHYDNRIENIILPRFAYCSAQYNDYMFDPDGRIYSCLKSLGKKNWEIGTYYPEYNLYNKSIATRNLDTMEKCQDCKYALLCAGGYPIHLDEEDDLYTEVCAKTKHLFEEIYPSFFYEQIFNNK